MKILLLGANGSLGYGFAGDTSPPYLETAATHPLGEYSRSKLAGDEAGRSCCDLHCIIRTAWVYGAQGLGDFVKTMLRLGRDRSELRVVVDRAGSPTWSRDLARAIADCIPKSHPDTLSSASSYGTYHYTNSGVASWYDFAVAMFEEASIPISR